MEEKTFDEVLTEFAKRDTAGFLVWGKKIETAHKREIGELKGERKGLLKANEAFAADNTRLRGEVAAKDAEIAELRERIKIAEDALKIIDNMCDGDMCKFFDNTNHCSACRYLNECQTGVAHAALAAISEKGEEDDK